MMWQHRASKITCGQARVFRQKRYLKIYYIYITAHSQMTADQEMKRSELKQGLIQQPLRLQKRFPVALASIGLYPSHTTTQLSCAFQLICMTVPHSADPKIARYDLSSAWIFCTDNSMTLLMARKGLCKLRANFTIHC